MQITRTQNEFVNILKKKTTTTKITNRKTSNKRTNIGENRDLHVHSNILLLADVLEKFKNMCHKIY